MATSGGCTDLGNAQPGDRSGKKSLSVLEEPGGLWWELRHAVSTVGALAAAKMPYLSL